MHSPMPVINKKPRMPTGIVHSSANSANGLSENVYKSMIKEGTERAIAGTRHYIHLPIKYYKWKSSNRYKI